MSVYLDSVFYSHIIYYSTYLCIHPRMCTECLIYTRYSADIDGSVVCKTGKIFVFKVFPV